MSTFNSFVVFEITRKFSDGATKSEFTKKITMCSISETERTACDDLRPFLFPSYVIQIWFMVTPMRMMMWWYCFKVGQSGTKRDTNAAKGVSFQHNLPTVRQNFKKISRWSQTNLICFLRSHPFSEERNVRLLWWRRRGAIFSHLRWFYLHPKNISLSLLPWLWPRTKENLCNILWLLKTSIVWFDRKYKMALFFCCQIFPNHG